jgi:actin-like ATPase involved in cell morphogenesis
MAAAESGDYVLGIDLGTTYSAAAIARDGRAEIVSLGHVAAVVPSVILVRSDGDVLVGEAAERRAASDPTRVAREFKRRLGDPVPLLLGGSPYGAEALMAQLLRGVYDTVVEQQGRPPTTTVVTHPANYGDYKLDMLREAVRLADIADVRFLNEPEAAATHYAQQDRLDDGEVVAVYDFGGGTFDAAVVRRRGDRFELLGTPEGMERLGGMDFDQAVFSHVMSSSGVGHDLDPTDPDVMSAVQGIREDCRVAKEALSDDTDVEVAVILPNLNTKVRVTRSEFEEMIRPRIAKTIESLRRAIRSADLDVEDVSRILLVGGSSRIPLVGEMVRSATGRPVTADAHPKHAIVLGAALAGAADGGAPIAVGAAGTTIGVGGPPPRLTDDGFDDDPTGRRRRPLLAAVAVIAALALGIGGLLVFTGDDAGDDTAAVTEPPNPVATEALATVAPATITPATDAPTTSASTEAEVIVTGGEVFLTALDDDGEAPFTESVAGEPDRQLFAFAAAGPPADPAAGPAAEESTGNADAADDSVIVAASSGTAEGVFAGQRGVAACDTDRLVAQLADDAGSASAWAAVEGIDESEIPSFVSTLTAILLTRDLRVTDHSFVDGLAVPRQAVLQIGTAVLVDVFGSPRVRCASGSPLTAPEPVTGTTAYVGAAWDTFEPDTIEIVVAAPEPATGFVLTDVDGGDPFTRPVGSTGLDDQAPDPGDVLAVGGFTDLGGFSGPFVVNEMLMTFPASGGAIIGTWTYSIDVQGVALSSTGELTGTYDPVTGIASGDGFGSVSGGGVTGGGSGAWSATIDTASGTLSGVGGDGSDTATFELIFEPYQL